MRKDWWIPWEVSYSTEKESEDKSSSSSSFTSFFLLIIVSLSLTSMKTSSFDDAVTTSNAAATTVCTTTSVVTLLIMSAKPAAGHFTWLFCSRLTKDHLFRLSADCSRLPPSFHSTHQQSPRRNQPASSASSPWPISTAQVVHPASPARLAKPASADCPGQPASSGCSSQPTSPARTACASPAWLDQPCFCSLKPTSSWWIVLVQLTYSIVSLWVSCSLGPVWVSWPLRRFSLLCPPIPACITCI